MLRHIPRAKNTHPFSFFIGPQNALYMAIDLHCHLQDMDCEPQAPMREEDDVIYYVWEHTTPEVSG